MDFLQPALPLIFSSICFVSGCGRSSPDAKDEPTMMDTIRSEVFGHPLYHPLDTLNQKFHAARKLFEISVMMSIESCTTLQF